MTFGTRLTLAMIAAAVLPIGAVAVVLRAQLGERVIAGYEQRVQLAAAAVESRLRARDDGHRQRLRALARDAADDNALRLALGGGAGDRQAVIDYAPRVMPLAGLGYLQLLDAEGRIHSSGHFRQEYDRLDRALPTALFDAGGALLVRARTAEGGWLALVRIDSVNVGAQRFYLVGGSRVSESDVRELIAGSDLRLELTTPDTMLVAGADTLPQGDARTLASVRYPYLGPDGRGEATLALSQPVPELAALRRSIDRAAAAIAGGAVALAIVLSAWLAARTSRPLRDLADRTAELDLDRLEADFRTDRDDEIGDLSRKLGAMTARLRTSVRRLREAERRATQGEMARQVNHDIKNGLVPIRNVLRHLAQVATTEPAELPRIFAERQGTLEGSVDYLDNLARSYARLMPSASAGAFALAPLIEEVAATARAGGARVETHVHGELPPVPGDPLAVRRILENLVGNAVDSLGDGHGRVAIAARLGGRSAARTVSIEVADDGRGMTDAELSRAFEDFHTTKPGGTGLGLSVVRRLVADLGGVLRVDTAPGEGTRVTVELALSGAAAHGGGGVASGAPRSPGESVRR